MHQAVDAACASVSDFEKMPCIVCTGADIDAVGFIFLRNISASVLYNVSYSGIPTDQVSTILLQMSLNSMLSCEADCHECAEHLFAR